jgi:hypothetical protein
MSEAANPQSTERTTDGTSPPESNKRPMDHVMNTIFKSARKHYDLQPRDSSGRWKSFNSKGDLSSFFFFFFLNHTYQFFFFLLFNLLFYSYSFYFFFFFF